MFLNSANFINPILRLNYMALTQHRSRRKSSGGKYHDYRKKRVFELGNHPTHTLLGEKKAKTMRGKGANTKRRLLSDNTVNVMDKGKAKKLKIITVVGNPANQNYTRRNIMTKGCIVNTEAGKVKITSRPGQHGVLNGVMVN